MMISGVLPSMPTPRRSPELAQQQFAARWSLAEYSRSLKEYVALERLLLSNYEAKVVQLETRMTRVIRYTLIGAVALVLGLVLWRSDAGPSAIQRGDSEARVLKLLG